MEQLSVIQPFHPILPKGNDLEEVVRRVMGNYGGVLDQIEGRMRRVPHSHQVNSYEFTDHFFQPELGIYARRMSVKAGTIIITKIHLSQHPFLISQGRCLVKDESTGDEVEIVGPYAGVTQPGTRRLIVILEDVIWITFHPTTKTDLAEIEREIILDYTPAIGDTEPHGFLQ